MTPKEALDWVNVFVTGMIGLAFGSLCLALLAVVIHTVIREIKNGK